MMRILEHIFFFNKVKEIGFFRVTALEVSSQNPSNIEEQISDILRDCINKKGYSEIFIGNKQVAHKIEINEFKLYTWYFVDKTKFVICTYSVEDSLFNKEAVDEELNYCIKAIESFKAT